jgi:hypothetical protein
MLLVTVTASSAYDVRCVTQCDLRSAQYTTAFSLYLAAMGLSYTLYTLSHCQSRYHRAVQQRLAKPPPAKQRSNTQSQNRVKVRNAESV